MVLINITTLGCPKNQADSNHLKKKFASDGFLHVDAPEDADIIVVNTCGFIKEAKEESIEEILRLAEMKKGKRKKLIVSGCLAKRYSDELKNDIPEIDGIFGVGEEDKIIEHCKKAEVQRSESSEGKDLLIGTSKPQSFRASYAYLKIAEGCDKKCTFCVIPSIRGKFRSIAPEQILKEAEEYIHSGVRELIIVAQDITSYGKELNYNLVSLLKDLASIKGDFRIRLLYLYPAEINDELLKFIASENKMHKYLDMPLQHSEDKVLRLMGRRGIRKEYIKLIRNIRKIIPGVALRTTFIVGFPGETEEDFNGLVDFVEEIRFDRLGVFKYSKEEGTPASKLKGHVPEKVKDRRFDEIMRRQSLISLQKNMEMIGKKYDAIIDEVDCNIVIARLYSHAPDVDGVVIIDSAEARKNRSTKEKDLKTYELLSFQASELKVGDLVTVEITDAFDYDLKGIIVN
jgi:ribosomal protein S12 methylthiotransferase